MKERPILMCAEMVRATLRDVDPKEQTRRAIKVPAWFEGHLIYAKNARGSYDVMADHEGGEQMFCPYGQPGDRLWVKETHARVELSKFDFIAYRATVGTMMEPNVKRWTPSIFMPRKLSRITLEIESVRVDRLNDISEEDARAEGCNAPTHDGFKSARVQYMELWASINGKGSWALNPWVWKITFRKL